jgi:hypothetical protein
MATLLQADVALLVREASRDMEALWRDVEDALAAEAALRDVMPRLVDTYGAAAATVAADWYDDQREADEIRGRFTAIPADIPETGTQALIGWALNEAKDFEGFKALLLGGSQRRIANFARQTVMGSSIADPQARGWKRVGSGSSCEFCSMLLGRGAVYTEATADFNAHDHDDCGAAPAWR